MGVCVQNFPCVAGGGRIEEFRNHFAADQKRVPVFAAVLRGNGPDALRVRALKRITEALERDGAERWAVDRSNHRRMAAARQSFTQAHLQRAELTKLWMGVADRKRSACAC